MKTSWISYCGAVLLFCLTPICSAGLLPTQLITEFDVDESQSILTGSVTVHDDLGPSLTGAGFALHPWAHRIEAAGPAILDANQAREVAALLGRRYQDPTPTPVKPFVWTVETGLNPVPVPMLPDWFGSLAGYTPNPNPPIGPVVPPLPIPFPPVPGPYCLSCPTSGIYETIGFIKELGDLQLGFEAKVGLLRTSIEFDVEKLEAISRDAYTVEQSFAGDGVIHGGQMDLLVYNPQQQAYESVMTAQLHSYSLEVAGPGDTNIDGIVNGADFLNMQRGYGAAFSSDEFGQFSSEFGRGISLSPAAAISAVPEPASLLLMALGATAIAVGRFRKVR